MATNFARFGARGSPLHVRCDLAFLHDNLAAPVSCAAYLGLRRTMGINMARVVILFILSLCCTNVALAEFIDSRFKAPQSVKGHWRSTDTFIEVINAAKSGEQWAIRAIIEEANEQKSPLLHVFAGEIYESETSPIRDSFSAERWYWKAAQAHHGDVRMVALAQEKLAMRARERINDRDSEKRALSLFLAAAVNGSNTAAFTTGQILITSPTEYFPNQKLWGIAFLRYASTGSGAKALADPYIESLRRHFGDEKWGRLVYTIGFIVDWWEKEGILGLHPTGDNAVPVSVEEGHEDEFLSMVANMFSDSARTTAKPSSSPERVQERPLKRTQDSPFTATRRAVRTDPPLVKVRNSSAYILTLTVGVNEHKISAHQSAEFEVTPGNHPFHASAPGVRPLDGEETFQNGYEYSWTFTVVTTKSRSRTRRKR